MATRTSQRIGIWVIAIIMLVGTIGGFAVLLIDPSGGAEVRQQAELEQQAKQMEEYEKIMRESAEARRASSRPLEGFEATAFDKASVTELKVETIKEGDGVVLSESSTISANYFGWTSDGKIFDSTNQDGKVEPAKFGLNQVIEGWTKGLTGVKVGSIVKLTIPTDMAYGDDESTGKPAGPLMFIIEVVEKVEVS